METTIKELVAVSGLSEPSIYKRIREHGQDLTWAHLDLDEARQKNALGAWRAKRAGKGSKPVPKLPVYDPSDRSPGWCERKYDFLRRAGQSGYGGNVGRSVFCGRTSSGGAVYGGG